MKSAKLSILLMLVLPFLGLAQPDLSLEQKVKSLLDFSVPTVNPEGVAKWQNVQVLDARERAEYDVSHLPDARYVGDKDFTLTAVSDLSKSDTILVYCTVGYRSEKVAEKLSDAGFENVYNLFGGIFMWKNSGRTVVDTTGKPTEKVHCYSRSWGGFLEKGEKVY